MQAALSLAVDLACGLGFFAAAAALYGRYRVLSAFLTGPEVCKREAGGCQALFRSAEAALLGPPNSLLGLFYYPAFAAGWHLDGSDIMLLMLACCAGLMSAFLANFLIKNKLECRICWLGHGCNAVLLAASLAKFTAGFR